MPAQEFFTPVAFDFLWEAMHIGELPYPLRLRSHGSTENERVSLRKRVDAELSARGIRDGQGRLDPRVEDWLTLLARGSVTIDALHIPDFQMPPVGALAASDGTSAVLALQDADGIWLREVHPSGLASAIVEVLPAGSRGTESSITLPLQEALHVSPSRNTVTAGAPAADSGTGRRRTRPKTALSERVADPRQAYAQLAGQPRIRGGQLAANSRNSVAGRRRSPVLAWFDTATGRYLSLSRSGVDGREWVTISPADAKTLRSRLGEMVTAIADDR